MKALFAVLFILLLGFAPTPNPAADDVADIKKATLDHFATLNHDAEAHIQHHLVGNTAYGADGGFLDSSSLEEQVAAMKADYDSGVRVNLNPVHIEVQVYGNAAVVTCYLVGTVTGPDGTVEQVTDRRTAVLIKQGGKWMEAHTHASPMVVAPAQ